MASKKAKQWLASIGMGIDDSVNSDITRGNFNAGSGRGNGGMTWHVVKFDKLYGSSQETVGYATDADVAEMLGNLRSSNCGRYGYYARNVQTGALRRQ